MSVTVRTGSQFRRFCERLRLSGTVMAVIEPAFLPVSTWDREFRASLLEHYSRSRGAPPGKKIAWRIMIDGRHYGWIGLGEPTFALAARRRLGIPAHPPLR